MPCAPAGRRSTSSSSGGRSTMIRPSTPASRRIAGEARGAVGMDGIVIAHQHDRRLVVGLAEASHQLQHAWPWSCRPSARAATRPGPPGRRPSDRRTACPARSDRRRRRAASPGSRSEVSTSGSPAVMNGTKAARSGALQFGEARPRCGSYLLLPARAATVNTSLSPRPDRQTAMILSLRHLRRDAHRHGRWHAPIPAPE